MAGLSAVLLALPIVTTYRDEPDWVTWGCWAFFAFSVVALADVLSQFLTLGESELRMRRNLRLREVARKDIESVAVAKGCPTFLIMKDGSKVEVPPLDANGLGNSIRAWLKATPPT